MIGIVNYGVGNIGSLVNALDYLGLKTGIINNPNEINLYNRLVLPGVGSFLPTMNKLSGDGWSQGLQQAVSQGVPLLGICLGMQILFEIGHEHGITPGLGFIPGRVLPFEVNSNYRVPHMGWNTINYLKPHPLFDGVKQHVDFYFVHSYRCVPEAYESVLAYCDYGLKFAAAVAKKNVIGVQFHPEKSQDMGLRVLMNFSKWDGSC